MAALNHPDPARPLGGRGAWLAGALVALVVNLPVLQGWWADRQLAAEGVEVQAEVVDTALLGSGDEARPVVAFALPRSVDEARSQWAVEVDRATYDEAETTGALDVRVLPGRPSVFEAEGAVRSSVGLWLTLAVDAVLLGLLVASLRRRAAGATATGPGARPGEGRPGTTGSGDGWPEGWQAADGGRGAGPPAAEGSRRLPEPGAGDPTGPAGPGPLQVGARDVARLVAESDLAPQGDGPPWQPHPDGSLELRGPLLAIRDDDVLLDVDGRRVVVALAGHRVGALRLGEPVQVRVRAGA